MSTPAGNALLSVYDKTGIAEFAKGLHELGWQLYASGGTAKTLADAGLPVTDVATLVGGEAILGHRVVTLSRAIHAGLLAERTPEHEAELTKLGIPRIDLVCNDMYPLFDAINDPKSTEKTIIEKTDMGGPAMLRSAAKARAIVLARPEQRTEVLDWLKAGKPDEESFRRKLAAVAEFEVARYVLDSAHYLGGNHVLGIASERVIEPQYGENRWQGRTGLYVNDRRDDPLALHRFALRQGATPSYNNYVDTDRMLQTMTHIAAGFDTNFGKVPAIAIGAKHGNACGTGIGATPEAAIKKMIDGDRRAIFGGSVMVNFTFDLNSTDVTHHGPEATKQQLEDLVLAWAIGCTSNSNTIALTRDGMLLGNGVGQQDRVSAAELAIKRAEAAHHDIGGAAAYSDSFFPFPDGPKALSDAGVTALFTTSGSVKDEEVFKSITDSGVALYTIPDGLGRGFFNH
jgi:AICAR transformylase/IMP cyclohydrolase PurH